MDDSKIFKKEVQDFWNWRAQLGQEAGTKDLIAKELEIEAIAAHVHDDLKVMDMGCGNGITAIELARRFEINLTGIDYAENMVEAARALAADRVLKGAINFQVGNILSLSGFSGEFDLVYTERTLINLPDWPSQKQAIQNIFSTLKPGGLYLMCENSHDGLAEMNVWRQRLGLDEIKPPWHNRYLRDDELNPNPFPEATLESISYYGATYYFLSRIVNAWLAAREHQEPEYNAPVNQLALQLPPLGDFGQGRLWIWRKHV
jgi:ubiquinone/menaquinone biosynthesis C-methylase UbiE